MQRIATNRFKKYSKSITGWKVCCSKLIRLACLSAINNSTTCGHTLSYDKATYDTSSRVSLKSNHKDGQWKVGHGRMRPEKRMHSPSLTSCRPNLWSTFNLLDMPPCSYTDLPGSSWKHTLHIHRVRSDRQGQDIQTPRARQDRFPPERERESTNNIAPMHNMQGVLKRLTSCQGEVLGFVGGTNRAWQGSDSLAGADITRQVQPDTFALPRIHCRPLFSSPSSRLQMTSEIVPIVSFFFNLLSIIADISGAMLPAQRTFNTQECCTGCGWA